MRRLQQKPVLFAILCFRFNFMIFGVGDKNERKQENHARLRRQDIEVQIPCLPKTTLSYKNIHKAPCLSQVGVINEFGDESVELYMQMRTCKTIAQKFSFDHRSNFHQNLIRRLPFVYAKHPWICLRKQNLTYQSTSIGTLSKRKYFSPSIIT